MAIISSYPTITPTSSDLVLVVDTSEDGNPTKTATIGSVNALGAAPDIQVSKKTITTAQLKTSGNLVVNVIDLLDNQVADVISVILKVNNQSAANKLTFADPLTIEPSALDSSPSYRYLIPISVANNETADQFYKPALEAGSSATGPIIGDVRFKSSVTSSNPVETGTATTTIDIYATYRIITL
jgi:hypothetical protein